jgi:hypothetical protein
MTKETYDKVEQYVKANYRLSYGKDDTLIIQEFDSYFTVRKHETSSPMILGKDII